MLYCFLQISEEATRGVLWKTLFIKISQNPHENNCTRVFFNKVAGIRTATLLKHRLWQVFSCEFFEILKNTSFTEHLQMNASEIWKVPTFPNLQMAVSVFISDKLDSCINVPVGYVNDNDVNKVH